MTELLPCPFCGDLVHRHENDGREESVWHQNSECPLNHFAIPIQNWNTRASNDGSLEDVSPQVTASESGGPSLPDGWVLVPREPTAETLDRMAEKAIRVALGGSYGWDSYMRDLYKIATQPPKES